MAHRRDCCNGCKGAVEVIFKSEVAEDGSKTEQLVKSYEEKFLNPFEAAKLGFLDDIIKPSETRGRIAKFGNVKE